MDIRIPLNWNGIINYLKARMKRQQVVEYVYDLIWAIAKAGYEKFETPMPTAVLHPEKKDTRTADEIKADIIKKLEGRG